MTFDQWLKARGFDAGALDAHQTESLRAMYKAEQGQAAVPVAAPVAQLAAEPAPQPSGGGGRHAGASAPPPAAAGSDRSLEEIVEAQNRERDRREQIVAMVRDSLAADQDMAQDVVADLHAAGRAAIDGRHTVRDFELTLLKLLRPRANVGRAVASEPAPADADVIEAAVCMHARLSNLEQQFSGRALEAARRRWRNGLGLADLVLTFARQNGFRDFSLRDGNLSTGLRAAWNAEIRAAGSTSPSTHTLSGVLSNVANKFLRSGFDAVDPSWRAISATRSVSDFKAITTYSMTGDMVSDELPPGGEIKHGTMGAEPYTNRVNTYAKMLGIDRRDLTNDDLGAFTDAGRKLGRGSAIKLNKVFWGVFLNNSAFFTTGRGNAFTGAGTALSITSLGSADASFRIQTDPDGNPLGLMPKILLVPPALRIAGINLVNSELTSPDSTGTLNTATGVMFPNRNPFAGAYTPVSSPYMQDASLTGNSSAAWYLLADPSDLAVIEVAFLNGNESPTVETADADFGTLGIAIRVFHDWGVAMQEYRAGVRMAGA